MNGQDSRFYLIQIESISQISTHLMQQNLKLGIQIGTKKVEINLQLDEDHLSSENIQNLKCNTYIFCYQAQQVMTIRIYDENQMLQWFGYAKILMTPILKMPHTKHQITINLIFQHMNKTMKNHISAVINLTMYFFTKFKAQIQIQPLYANLIHNVAHIGQMQPYVIFQVNAQKFQSEQVKEGGIHPKWPGYYKIKNQNNFEEQNNVQKSYTFNLNSAANQLRITMYSMPVIGNTPEKIGSSIIKMQQYNLFEIPNKFLQLKDNRTIALYYQNEHGQSQLAGRLGISFKFLFNLQKLIYQPGDLYDFSLRKKT